MTSSKAQAKLSNRWLYNKCALKYIKPVFKIFITRTLYIFILFIHDHSFHSFIQLISFVIFITPVLENFTFFVESIVCHYVFWKIYYGLNLERLNDPSFKYIVLNKMKIITSLSNTIESYRYSLKSYQNTVGKTGWET